MTVALTWVLARAACARAKGTLHTLYLDGVREVPLAALVELVAENGESLRSLKTPSALILTAENLARLRQAAPLCKLDCAVECTGAEVVALLRCELVCPFYLRVGNLNTQQQQTDFAAALATRTGITSLRLVGGNLVGGAALEDLARTIVSAGVEEFVVLFCRLAPMALPALTLLLRPSVLRYFAIYNRGLPLFTGPDLPAFCDALRSNSSLRVVHLDGCHLWANPAAAGMVLAALAACTTPFSLWLEDNRVGETQAQQFAAGTQLAQLITAAGLERLELIGCNLSEAGLAPIFEALPRASLLLDVTIKGEELSSEFARDVVLPSVRANNSLRELKFYDGNEDEDDLLPELIEAQNIVNARRNV